MFPVDSSGVIKVCSQSLKALGRQQRKRLVMEGTKQLWRWLIVMVLNGEYMDWNPDVIIKPSKPNLAQVASMEMIGDTVVRFMGDPLCVHQLPCYRDLLLSKSIDYAGEEISHALPLCLEELLPGLPDAAVGGSLDVLEVVDEANRTWLEDPAKCLKPQSQWPETVPQARINATREEWNRLVGELFQRNIITTIEEKDIFKVGGTAVLNGAFAVAKSGIPGPGAKRITRLIMNMVPSNSYQFLMKGDLNTLSSSSNWGSLILPPGHTLLWSSDDQKGAFYAWRLPPAWRPYMAFRWPVPGELVGRPGEQRAYVCSAVIPMGWLSAVSLFQHLHRRLGVGPKPLGAGFAAESEWRRDRAIPQAAGDEAISWLQYYLDDFDAPEVVPSDSWVNMWERCPRPIGNSERHMSGKALRFLRRKLN